MPLDPPVISTWASAASAWAGSVRRRRPPGLREIAFRPAKGTTRTYLAYDLPMDIASLLGDDADSLLTHVSKGIPKEDLHLPGPDFVDRIWVEQRPARAGAAQPAAALRQRPPRPTPATCRSCRSTRASSTRPARRSRRTRSTSIRENIVELAIEGGCNAVASTFGVLGSMSRKYAHKIPFIVKINHNELLTYPNKFDQIMFGSVEQAYDLGAAGVGATIYFGSDESTRQIQEVADAFAEAHELGMFTVLWCYLRNSAFKQGDNDYHVAADLTGQANHLGVTIEADIIKQKLPENNGGYNALKGYGKTSKLVYDTLTTDHPIDLTRYQVANCYMGRAGLINSGGASSGETDLAEAVRTAVINKRAGGTGLISGRKAFQRPMAEGIELLNAIQDVYLDESITIA